MKPESYHYIGSPELNRPTAIPRLRVSHRSAILPWVRQQSPESKSRYFATYIISTEQKLWISDRHSEHVACAAGQPVLAAGEIEFVLEQELEVEYLSNQSLGYCPRVSCWTVVDEVLTRLQIPHPERFTLACQFRRCEQCAALQIVKDEY